MPSATEIGQFTITPPYLSMVERTGPKTGGNAHRLGVGWGLGLELVLVLGSAIRPVPPCLCYRRVRAEETE